MGMDPIGSLEVSIPYRYTKNGFAVLFECFRWKVSIPYRYTKNVEPKEIYEGVNDCVSIPYRYTKNPFMGHVVPPHTSIVSIPYRYTKNVDITISTRLWKVCFNPL